jgi:hypothetical protein
MEANSESPASTTTLQMLVQQLSTAVTYAEPTNVDTNRKLWNNYAKDWYDQFNVILNESLLITGFKPLIFIFPCYYHSSLSLARRYIAFPALQNTFEAPLIPRRGSFVYFQGH